MGTETDPDPVAVLTLNFSPMPRMAPPPLGRWIAGSGPGSLFSMGDAGAVEAEVAGIGVSGRRSSDSVGTLDTSVYSMYCAAANRIVSGKFE